MAFSMWWKNGTINRSVLPTGNTGKYCPLNSQSDRAYYRCHIINCDMIWWLVLLKSQKLLSGSSTRIKPNTFINLIILMWKKYLSFCWYKKLNPMSTVQLDLFGIKLYTYTILKNKLQTGYTYTLSEQYTE